MVSKRLFILLAIMATGFYSVAQFSPNQSDLSISVQEKKQIIDTIIKTINEAYVFPEIALVIEKEISIQLKKGHYNNITSSKEFADTISSQLMRFSKDKHLRILFSHDKVPYKTEKEAPLPDFIKTFAIENNYGFNKINILEGNIGYLNIVGFFPFDEATNKAISAFDFLSETQALIIDLRENTGGFGSLANFILSYFFDNKPVHFLDFTFRKENRLEQAWSSFYIPGKRYVNKPVYILTSAQTFSAGEAFAYILQANKRATVIGAQTGGGANIGDLIRLGDHFVMNIPLGRGISPITNTNWEGVGVKPDVDVLYEKALTTAHIAALKKLIETSSNEKTKSHLTDILKNIR
ncbi:MAG TPA: S41 family peptidase [Niastella sp.]